MRYLKRLCIISLMILMALVGMGLVVLKETNVMLWLDGFDASRVDARIAEARKVSDAAAVEVLREMLREKSFSRERALSRIYSLKFPPAIAAAASPELVTILEEDFGSPLLATEELQRIGKFIPDSVVPRLVELTKNGDPDWRKANAAFVLKSKWHGKDVDDPTVAEAIANVEQSEWFRRVYRSGSEQHSGHAEHGFGSGSSQASQTYSETNDAQARAKSRVEQNGHDSQ